MTLPRARIEMSALRRARARFVTRRTALLLFAVVMTAIFVFPFTLLFAKDRAEQLPPLRCSSAMAWRTPSGVGDVRCEVGTPVHARPLPPAR